METTLILLLGLLLLGVLAFLSSVKTRDRKKISPIAESSPKRPPSSTTVPPMRSAFQDVSKRIETNRQDPGTFWVAAGEQVKVGDYTIRNGLVYVGTGLLTERGDVEPALIDPELAVDVSSVDRAGASMTYWPSYSRISPQARSAYLEWLAGGRRAPNTYIGYVFLFFYGLERRLLIDSKTSLRVREEVPQIISEVQELLKIYSDNGSFKNYANSFVELAKLDFDPDSLNIDPSSIERTWYFPLPLKLALGRYAATESPLPAEWAFAWAINDPEKWFRTPAHRCKAELLKLFTFRYHKAFGNGLVVPPGKTKIRLEYRPASGALLGSTAIVETDHPDVAGLGNSPEKLHRIIDSCIDDLDSYSRFLGRRPADADSLLATSLLPLELLQLTQNKKLDALRNYLQKQMELGPTNHIVQTRDLLRFFDLVDGVKPQKADVVSIAQLLGNLGFGLIPDVRFEDVRLDPDQDVILFRIGIERQSVATKAYSAALTIVTLSSAVISADDRISPEERSFLEGNLARMLDLTEYEKTRLRAYAEWCYLGPLRMAGLKRRIGELETSERQVVADSLVRVANADGTIHPNEVRVLKKIYQHLELDPNQVYTDIHRIQTSSDDEMVTVIEGTSQTKGYAIPRRVGIPKKEGIVEFDEHAMAKTMRDTEKVQAILSGVFSDDVVAVTISPSQIKGLMGLDSLHSVLLSRLVEKLQWTEAEFVTLCSDCGVMPAGAIETINSQSFEKYNDALIEEGNTLQINPRLAKEIIN